MPEIVGKSSVATDGLTILTTYRASAQRSLDDLVRFTYGTLAAQSGGDRIEVAGAIVSPASGGVLAEAGSHRFDDSQFNRITQMGRPLAGAALPLLTMHSIGSGFHLNHRWRVDASSLFELYCRQDPGDPLWEVSYWGPSFDQRLKRLGLRREFAESRGSQPVTIEEAIRLLLPVHPQFRGEPLHRIKRLTNGQGEEIYRQQPNPGATTKPGLGPGLLYIAAGHCQKDTFGRLPAVESAREILGAKWMDTPSHNALLAFWLPHQLVVIWVGSEFGRLTLSRDQTDRLFRQLFARLHEESSSKEEKLSQSQAKSIWLQEGSIGLVPLQTIDGRNLLVPMIPAMARRSKLPTGSPL
jgi:hypothetical protein